MQENLDSERQRQDRDPLSEVKYLSRRAEITRIEHKGVTKDNIDPYHVEYHKMLLTKKSKRRTAIEQKVSGCQY